MKNLARVLYRLHLEIVFVTLNEGLPIMKFVGVVPSKTAAHLEQYFCVITCDIKFA